MHRPCHAVNRVCALRRLQMPVCVAVAGHSIAVVSPEDRHWWALPHMY